MKSMKYGIGLISQRAVVEITNRQQCVEYKIISGWADERDIRSTAGNCGKSLYAHSYDGYHFHRKPAIERLEGDIAEAKKLLAELEFSLKVTKKKTWVKVEGHSQ